MKMKATVSSKQRSVRLFAPIVLTGAIGISILFLSSRATEGSAAISSSSATLPQVAEGGPEIASVDSLPRTDGTEEATGKEGAEVQPSPLRKGEEAKPVPPQEEVQAELTKGDLQSIEEKWGIKVLVIRRSATGYMLDFRYRIIDPDKASLLVKRNSRPYLIDQASGAKFMVPSAPKIGALRQTSVKPYADRNYFILFANPGKFVKPGNKVTVVIGDFRVTDLVVE
jgi:hypothetical protein